MFRAPFKVNASTRADATLLEYLRVDAGLTGTKEGCASGDCGACTCLVRSDANTPYQAVNACITPLGDVVDHEILTVDGLGEEGLHPVQSAMVSEHGSQCGFCTPGFVMALAARLDPNHPQGELTEVSDREAWNQAIAGNLCRCTGYRPILDAAKLAAKSDTDARTLPQGLVIDTGDGSSEKGLTPESLGGFFRPRSLAAFRAARAAYPEAHLCAGGTDLMLEVTQKGQTLNPLISLTGIEEMRSIAIDGDASSVHIGASVTFSEMELAFEKVWPKFASFLTRIGSPQIRNRGTLGGNLGTASPIGDGLPVLLAMDAVITTLLPNGDTRSIAMSEFIKGYRQTALQSGEVITSIQLAGIDDPHDYRKVTKRYEDDISAVCGAFRWRVESGRVVLARVAYGGVAERPLRLMETELLLTSRALTPNLIKEAVELARSEVSPLSDVRASARYRQHLVGVLLQDSLEAQLATMSGGEISP